MTGCFGNSDYDRWLEKKTLDHTDPDYFCEYCEAETQDLCICNEGEKPHECRTTE